jgi:hypothetical protein
VPGHQGRRTSSVLRQFAVCLVDECVAVPYTDEMDAKLLRSLACAAVAAPSADNHHTFRLAATGSTVSILATPELAIGPKGRRILAQVSIGCVVENLRLRAARFGIDLQLRTCSAPEHSGVLVELEAKDATPTDSPFERAIEGRHTNRRLIYRGPKLQPGTQEEMSGHCAGLDGARLVWLDESKVRQQAVKLVELAEVERFRNPWLHREMFDAIRFDAGWTQSVTDGIPLGALDLPRFERPMFAMMRHWPVQRAANLVGLHRFVGLRGAALPCHFAPHLCVITAKGEVNQAAIDAGRLLQRVWLHAQTLGLAFQMFAASAVYAIDDAYPVPEALRMRLADGWNQLCQGSRPYLVCRMGYAQPPTLRAGRPPAESILA